MFTVISNRPMVLDFNSLTEFEKGFLSRGFSEFFKTTPHPHIRSKKLRVYPSFVTEIKDLCSSFEKNVQSLLTSVYQLGYSPEMAGASFWDKRLYDVDDREITIEWIKQSYKFPNPKFSLQGDIIQIIDS